MIARDWNLDGIQRFAGVLARMQELSPRRSKELEAVGVI